MPELNHKIKYLVVNISLTLIFCFYGNGTIALALDKLESDVQSKYYEVLADQHYLSKEIPGNLNRAISYYKKAIQLQSKELGLEWKITRCYWVLASRTVKPEEREAFFNEGTKYGKLAVRKSPENSNSHLWLALIIGSSSIDQGVVNSLYNREPVKKGLETAIKLDPENTNAYFGLANWYFYVPGIFGGNKTRAYQMIEKAIKMHPNYTAAILGKAEFLIQDQKTADAIKVLNSVLRVKMPLYRGDGVIDKWKAKKLLEMLNRTGSFI